MSLKIDLDERLDWLWSTAYIGDRPVATVQRRPAFYNKGWRGKYRIFAVPYGELMGEVHTLAGVRALIRSAERRRVQEGKSSSPEVA